MSARRRPRPQTAPNDAPVRRRRAKKAFRPDPTLSLITALLLCLTACYLSLLFRQVMAVYGGGWPQGVQLAAQAGASVVCFLLPAVLGLFVLDGDRASGLRLSALSPGHKLYLSLLGVTLIFPMTLMNDLYGYLLTSARPGAVQGMASAQESALFLFAALKSALLAPLCEEAFFRGYLLGALERYGKKTAVFAAALAFALAHGLDVQLFVPRLLLGVLLGAVMLRADSLLAPVLVHGAYNLTILLVSYMGLSALFDRLTMVSSLVRLVGCWAFYAVLAGAFSACPSRRPFHLWHGGRLRAKEWTLLICAALLAVVAAMLSGVML